MMRIVSSCILAAALVVSCAPPSTTTGQHDSNVITQEEISKANVNNAYDAVTLLRPQFLRYHGHTSVQKDTSCVSAGSRGTTCKAPIEALGGDTGYARIYLNHQFYGDIASLRGIEASGIREIHYYNTQEASNRFGLGNVWGAIEVVTGVMP